MIKLKKNYTFLILSFLLMIIIFPIKSFASEIDYSLEKDIDYKNKTKVELPGIENTQYEVSGGYSYIVQKSGLYAFSIQGSQGFDSTTRGVTGKGGQGGYGVGYIKVKKGDIFTFIKDSTSSKFFHNGNIVAISTKGDDGKSWSKYVETIHHSVCDGTIGYCYESRNDNNSNACEGMVTAGGTCTHTVIIGFGCCDGVTREWDEDVYIGEASNGSDGFFKSYLGKWHNDKFTNVEGFAKENTNIIDNPKDPLGYTNLNQNDTSVWVLNVKGSYPLVYELNDGYFPNDDFTLEGNIDEWTEIKPPARNGFTFIGWDVVSGMDTNKHGIKGDNKKEYYTNTTILKHNVFSNEYTYVYNLNESGDTVKLVANWLDISPPEFFDDLGNINGVSFRLLDDGLNPDKNLKVLSSNTPSETYKIKRNDGNRTKINIVTVNEKYENKHINKITALKSSNSNPNIYDLDFIKYNQYPNTFGYSQNNQFYYTGTWTNKSVIVNAKAYDGYKDDYQSIINNAGGSGIDKMRFNNESWQNNKNKIPNQEPMTISKVYVGIPNKVKIYKENQTVTAVDRANLENKKTGLIWDANNKSNEKTITYIDSSKEATWIKIDMQKPSIFNPEIYKGKDNYQEMVAKMYEGYNEVSEDDSSYGWSQDNVRIVIYATDGDGSGIQEQAYCWVPDNSGINYRDDKNWQSADSIREYTYSYISHDGKKITKTEKIPVSTRVISDIESGYVYVRDAVGNYDRIRYNADHIDKDEPIIIPEYTPPGSDDSDDSDDSDPNPLDETDPENEITPEPTPEVPDGEYTFKAQENRNEIKYDWINKNGTLSFSAYDFGKDKNGKFVYGNGTKNGASGIWKMTLYRSNENFETELEELKNNTTRQRAKKDLYGSDTIAKEVLFTDKFKYIEHREGINYYILEIIDKANNLTSVKLTVKIDKTYPGIPFLKSELDNFIIGKSNGAHRNLQDYLKIGNELSSNFSNAIYWDISQVNLNDVDYNDIISFIQNENNMMCNFAFTIFDENWSGMNKVNNSMKGNYDSDYYDYYAYGSDRSKDSSGIDKIILKLINANDDSDHISYILYDYSNLNKIGFTSVNNIYKVKNKLLNLNKTTESNVGYFEDVLKGVPYVRIGTNTDINTFKDFPKASALNYEVEIIDRAGNIKTYSNQPGNEIKNFSIKAIMRSGESQEYDNELEYTQKHIVENSTNIKRKLYYYENRRGIEYKSTYKLSEEEEKAKGLKYLREELSYDGKANSNSIANITSLTSIPYYQLGDIGYVEIWTVGYISKVQFNFTNTPKTLRNGINITIGEEMVNEILSNKIPKKYNLGILGENTDISFTRFLPVSVATKIDVSYAQDISLENVDYTVPFAAHYGLKEYKSIYEGDKILEDYWLNKGTFIRMPIYYELSEDENKLKEDGKSTYIPELHTASFYGWKNGWKDTSSASFVIYDTKSDDIHYRLTHESTSLDK